MKYLIDNLSYLDELTSQERLDHLLVHYRKVPAPIVEYALCKHYSACQMIEEFSDVNLNESSIVLKHFSTHQIFEEIDYGSFCSFRDESEYYYHTAMENNLEEYHIRNGSWRAPIVVVKRGNIYKALDGNNRLRMLRCYIRWSNKSYSEMHDVYVIEKSDNYLEADNEKSKV